MAQKRRNTIKKYFFYEFLPSGEYAIIRTRGAAHIELLIREEVGFGVVVNKRRLRILQNTSFQRTV
jgi:hypothetical protein